MKSAADLKTYFAVNLLLLLLLVFIGRRYIGDDICRHADEALVTERSPQSRYVCPPYPSLTYSCDVKSRGPTPFIDLRRAHNLWPISARYLWAGLLECFALFLCCVQSNLLRLVQRRSVFCQFRVPIVQFGFQQLKSPSPCVML
jgi:hypothetical protein